MSSSAPTAGAAAPERRRRSAGETFSLARVVAIMLKEFVQMKRDRLTFAMIVGIPILQLVLFGYAINTDPKDLPTAVVDYDRSDLTRSITQGLENTGYYAVVAKPAGEADADRLIARGEVQFALVFPPDFTRK